MTKPNSGLAKIVRELPATLGAALGASIGAQTGDAVMGATVGQVFTSVGSDFVDRWLSPRQESRVETVLALAARELRRQIDDGDEIPSDGLVTAGGQDAVEIVEGVLLVARDEHEERKLPYVAKLLATLAMTRVIDVDTAHRIISDADELSWLSLRLLSIVARPDEFPLPLHGEGGTPRTWTEVTVVEALNSLEEEGYLRAERDTSNPGRLPVHHVAPGGKRVANRGQLLVSGMDLQSIPADDLRELHELIVKVWNRPSDSLPDA